MSEQSRQKLSPRRASMAFEFHHSYPSASSRLYTAHAGFYADGRIGEVFLSLCDGAEKNLNVDQRDACIALSLALQYGADLSSMAKSMLRGANGAPHGFMGSLIDAVLKLKEDLKCPSPQT